MATCSAWIGSPIDGRYDHRRCSTFFHGTKAGLRVGDVLTAGFGSGAGDIIN